MYLRRDQIPILIINAVVLCIFAVVFSYRKDYEFIAYIGEIILFLTLIVASNRKMNYPNDILWGLTVWAAMHMSGGGVYVGGAKLYDLMLLPISASYEILKYDQVVHAFGFFVATLVMHHLIAWQLRPGPRGWISLSIVVVMAGLGTGALNEIIEFTATLFFENTGVGGYVNTSLDLVADLVGALAALVFIRIKTSRAVA